MSRVGWYRFILVAFVFCGLNAVAAQAPKGIVRLDGRVLRDADGPFLGLGATYMQALRHCKHDRDRLNKELAFLSDCGFNYVRVLSMVDWPGLEIPPVTHKNKSGATVTAWPDYEQQLSDLVDIVYAHGMRTELTIFADAQYVMPDVSERRQHVRRVLHALQGREEKVILYEIANEGWQNGFPGEEGVRMLRELADEIAERSQVLLALTSPSDMEDKKEALDRMYKGSPAGIATVHFSRDLGSEIGPWLPVIDCWTLGRHVDFVAISSNEPIGPGSSVASESDPELIQCAAAFAYLAGLPMYVFHSAAGVRAEESFCAMPWLRQMKPLLALLPPDLPNWTRFHCNRKESPLVCMARGISPLYNCGARKGGQFILLPLAIDGPREFRASQNMEFSVFSIAGSVIEERVAAEGETFAIKGGLKSCLVKGALRD